MRQLAKPDGAVALSVSYTLCSSGVLRFTSRGRNPGSVWLQADSILLLNEAIPACWRLAICGYRLDLYVPTARSPEAEGVGNGQYYDPSTGRLAMCLRS